MRIDVPIEYASNPSAYVSKSYAREIVQSGLNFSTTTYAHSKLSLREFEGARMRTAAINGCQICLNFRAARDVPGYLKQIGRPVELSVADNGSVPDEAFYAAVQDWRNATIFTDRERTAIEYAELMGLDPHGAATNEEFWARAKALFSDDEIVDLSYCIAAWMGLGRMAHVLGLDTVCAM